MAAPEFESVAAAARGIETCLSRDERETLRKRLAAHAHEIGARDPEVSKWLGTLAACLDTSVRIYTFAP